MEAYFLPRSPLQTPHGLNEGAWRRGEHQEHHPNSRISRCTVSRRWLLPLQHPAALAAVCVLHGHKDRAKVSLKCKSSADLHRQEYLHIHSGVAGPVLPGMFPPKLVATMRLASAVLDNMHGLAVESTPKLRTRYNEPCYGSRMKMASGTVKCWPETILLGTSSWHRGMGNAAGNFASRTLLGTHLFCLCIFVSPLFLELVSTRAPGASGHCGSRNEEDTKESFPQGFAFSQI